MSPPPLSVGGSGSGVGSGVGVGVGSGVGFELPPLSPPPPSSFPPQIGRAHV